MLPLAVAIAAICVAGHVIAADTVSLHVKPTTVTLAPGQNAAVITITNEGGTPVNAQIRVLGWDQSQDKDQLSETNKLVASPPAINFAAGQSQSIRIVRTDKSPATHEEAYRVLVDEIPDKTSAPQVGVQLRMRYSLPVFVQPKSESAQGKVDINAQVQGSNLVLTAQNNGAAHAQAADVMLDYGGQASTPVVKGLLGYVLPGKRMQWTLPIPSNAAAQGKATRVTASLNGQPVEVAL
ncbi:fimbria/pilus periplasmic chaperone [Dyella sp. AtDHG13]|uniref:fimbrial biogenesis chaperone n=1 Tax=Dyella sp. AtDHG13 TaxID=1938897 RepID=UPI000945B540|nr:fimbria/pilus periplasmic chaperone [Dyella sp. AtDHG13]